MKLKIIFLSLFCLAALILTLLNTPLFAALITVNIDGSGDFSQISPAVNASTAGDTIKVFPGSYQGNIMIENKTDLTIASLYHWTAIDSFKHNTIVDGQMQDFGFRIDLSSEVTIQGFSITKCIAPPRLYYGAAINVRRSDPVKILDNLIYDNYASWGAGINVSGNYPDQPNYVIIENNRITENYAGDGAGATFSQYSHIGMGPESHNSIHSNYASFGADLFWDCNFPGSIYLDTLSVASADDNFSPYFYYDNEGNCELVVENHQLQLLDRDLYVDAELGNNNNPGTIAEPLQTITHALSRARSNPNQANTVYVNPGIYSNESTDLPFKDNLNLVGLAEGVILDFADRLFFTIIHATTDLSFLLNNEISNLEIINAAPPRLKMFRLSNTDYVSMKNIKILNTSSGYGIFSFWRRAAPDSQILMKDINVVDFSTDSFLNCTSQNLDIINCSFRNSEYTYWGEGGGKSIIGLYGYTYDPIWPRINIINTEISNHEAAGNWPNDPFAVTGIATGYMTKVNIINSTITQNRGVPSYYYPNGETGKAITFFKQDSYVNIVNSIIYDNDEYDIGYKNESFYYPNDNYSLNVVNSIVGNHEMILADPQINFSNVWSDDPAFAGEEAEYPFSLLESSIAIDAGVMNFGDYLPADFEFPETDLAGNPRISGSGIDLGAYEFQQEVSAAPSDLEEALPEQIIGNYPNPGRLDYSKNIATKISLNLPESGNYQLCIYNIKGQIVRQILDAYLAKGNSVFSWDGRDANKRLVGSGNYLVKLTCGAEVIATHQLLMLK